MGFYLINLGYVALELKADVALNSPREAIESVSDKLGLVLLVLGFMHFFNLFIFSRLRKRSELDPRTMVSKPWSSPQEQAK